MVLTIIFDTVRRIRLKKQKFRSLYLLLIHVEQRKWATYKVGPVRNS